MPLLAQLVVQYVIDASQLTAGATAAADAVATVGAAAEESSAYLDSLGSSAFTTGAGFNGLTDTVAELDASLVGLGASSAEAVAGRGGVTDATAAADVATAGWVAGLGGVTDGLATTGISAEGAMVKLSGFAASENEVAIATGAISGALGLIIPALGILAGIVAVVSTKMAGDFESAITNLETGAGELHSNLKMVSDGILNMAPAVGESTKQLTDGMFMIESASQHGAQALNTLKMSAEGAKVGNADLGAVANAVTTEMTNYKDTNLTAAQATNTLIATVSAGKTHMQDLTLAMANVLPIGAKAGISLTDMSAAMATMTGKGIPAADAATYLRQTIMSLENPTTKARDEFKAMGLDSDKVAAEMKVSLPNALQMITEAAGKKFSVGSAEYIAAVANMVGGTKSMQGIMNLTGSDLNTFKTNVTNISGAVKTGGNDISGWAQKQQDFNQKMDQAKASLETVGISIGTKLLPVGNRLMDFLASPAFTNFATIVGTDIVNGINGFITAISTVVGWVQQFSNFLQNNQVAMDLFIGALTAAAILIGGPLVLAFIGWAAAALLAGIDTLIAMAPIILIGALIALVVAGIILAYQHWGAIVAWFQGLWGAFSHYFMDGLSAIGSLVSSVVSSIVGFFQGLWAGIWGAISSIPGKFMDFWNGLKTDAINAGEAIIKGLADAITGAIHWVTDAVTNVTSWISAHLPHSPAKVGPLVHLQEQGAEISNQIAQGMLNGTPLITGAMNNMLKPVAVSIKGASTVSTVGSTNTGGNNQQTITIIDQTTHIMTVDGKVLAKTAGRGIQKELRGHGLKK